MSDAQAPKEEGRPAQLLRCAYCHADSPEADLVACPGCATRRHPACQAESPGCPTLGCAHAVRMPRSVGATSPRGPRLPDWRVLLLLGVIGSGLFLVAVVSAGLLMYDDWSHRPVITLRNDSGRTLANVRLLADEPTGPREAFTASFGPGDELRLRGESVDTKLCLHEVTVDGKPVLNEPRNNSRYEIQGRDATFYIDQEERFGPKR